MKADYGGVEGIAEGADGVAEFGEAVFLRGEVFLEGEEGLV